MDVSAGLPDIGWKYNHKYVKLDQLRPNGQGKCNLKLNSRFSKNKIYFKPKRGFNIRWNSHSCFALEFCKIASIKCVQKAPFYKRHNLWIFTLQTSGCIQDLNGFKCLHCNWGFEAASMIKMSLTKKTDNAEMRVCVFYPRFTHCTFTDI